MEHEQTTSHISGGHANHYAIRTDFIHICGYWLLVKVLVTFFNRKRNYMKNSNPKMGKGILKEQMFTKFEAKLCKVLETLKMRNDIVIYLKYACLEKAH